jgi:hypothetical protein
LAPTGGVDAASGSVVPIEIEEILEVYGLTFG